MRGTQILRHGNGWTNSGTVCVYARDILAASTFHLRIEVDRFEDQVAGLRCPDLTSKTRTGTDANVLYPNDRASLWWCIGCPRDGR